MDTSLNSGDRVRLVDSFCMPIPQGTIGTIRAMSGQFVTFRPEGTESDYEGWTCRRFEKIETAKQEQTKLKVGDVVRLKSDRTKMTVEKVGTELVYLVHFLDGRLVHSTLPPAALTKLENTN